VRVGTRKQESQKITFVRSEINFVRSVELRPASGGGHHHVHSFFFLQPGDTVDIMIELTQYSSIA
jgi:hypothetical protein